MSETVGAVRIGDSVVVWCPQCRGKGGDNSCVCGGKGAFTCRDEAEGIDTIWTIGHAADGQYFVAERWSDGGGHVSWHRSITGCLNDVRGRTDDTYDREALGRAVRTAWVEYCIETGDTKPSHVAPWDELSDWDKEADRRIGEAIAAIVLDRDAE